MDFLKYDEYIDKIKIGSEKTVGIDEFEYIITNLTKKFIINFGFSNDNIICPSKYSAQPETEPNISIQFLRK